MKTPRLHIVIVGLHYSPEPSGNAPYTTSLAEGLAAAGHNVQVITGFPHYPEWRIHRGYTGWTRTETLAGVSVKRLRHFVPRTPHVLPRLIMEISFGLRVLLAGWGRPDVVLLVSPALFACALTVLKARMSRIRPGIGIWIQDIYSRGLAETHAAGSGTARLSRYLGKFESFVYCSTDGVVAIHERFKQHMVNSMGIAPGLITVIRNWTHLPQSPAVDRAKTRELLGWSPDDVIALHSGNMGKKQGLENLIEAAVVAHRRNSPVRFVLMGDGNQRRLLQSLTPDVPNVGFMDSLPTEQFQNALAAADVLVVNELPGLKDMSVPSKLTSYFSTGVPVVAATDELSVTATEITASGGGIRVDAADPDALLSAVELLAADRATAKHLGENGLRFRREILSKDVAIAHYDEFITNLASLRDR